MHALSLHYSVFCHCVRVFLPSLCVHLFFEMTEDDFEGLTKVPVYSTDHFVRLYTFKG